MIQKSKLDDEMLQGYDPLERIRIMENSCDEVIEDYHYERPLSDEEIAQEREEYCELEIEIQKIEAEKAGVVATYNAKIKERRAAAGIHLEKVKTGRTEVHENVYVFIKEEAGMVGTYNRHGQLISERRLKGMQKKMKLSTQDYTVTMEDGFGRKKVV